MCSIFYDAFKIRGKGNRKWRTYSLFPIPIPKLLLFKAVSVTRPSPHLVFHTVFQQNL
jgi:hypothetical protein